MKKKKMLDGVLGTGPQSAMRLLVTLGEIYGAKRMIPVSSCHVGGRSYLISGEANIEWMNDLRSGGAHFRVFTSTHPCSVDMERWREMGLPEKLVLNQRRTDETYLQMGAVPLGSCLPYQLGNLPLPGTHFAWGGSAGATFVNSVFGARGNREGSPSVGAAAITGKIFTFPHGKGSTAGSYIIYAMAKRKTAPVAMINVEAEPIIAVGAAMGNIPLVDRLDKNPLEVIATGDYVRIDGDQGIVEITKR